MQKETLNTNREELALNRERFQGFNESNQRGLGCCHLQSFPRKIDKLASSKAPIAPTPVMNFNHS